MNDSHFTVSESNHKKIDLLFKKSLLMNYLRPRFPYKVIKMKFVTILAIFFFTPSISIYIGLNCEKPPTKDMVLDQCLVTYNEFVRCGIPDASCQRSPCFCEVRYETIFVFPCTTLLGFTSSPHHHHMQINFRQL